MHTIEEVKDVVNSFSADPKFRFIERKHSYYYGTRYLTSVTGRTKKYKKPFDVEGISKRVADRDGRDQEEVKAEWKAKGDRSAAIGTFIHKNVEFLLFGEEMVLTPQEVEFSSDNSIMNRIAEVEKFIYEMQQKGILFIGSEVRVFSIKRGIAGTIDIIAYDPETSLPFILDWKSNEKFTTDEDHHFDMLLTPFHQYKDNHLNGYSLQTSLYELILNDKGLKTGPSILAHVPPYGSVQPYKAVDFRGMLM